MMKYLFDFDGTLTDISHEHEFELLFYERTFQTRYGMAPDTFRDHYRRARQFVFSEPHRHGWLYNGRMSAYCDEDLFMDGASVMTLLDTWKNNPPQGFAAFFYKTRGASFIEIAEQAHTAMREQPLTAFNTPTPDAVSTIQSLLTRGDQVVIVSNSSTDIIKKKCHFAGLDPLDHETTPEAQFRVRGNAKKYRLDDTPDLVTFDSRTVDIARSSYRAILEDERPQFVVGDVFSLDLALPIEMARRDPKLYSEIQVFLIKRAYTSPWAMTTIRRPQHSEDSRVWAIESLEELLFALPNSALR